MPSRAVPLGVRSRLSSSSRGGTALLGAHSRILGHAFVPSSPTQRVGPGCPQISISREVGLGTGAGQGLRPPPVPQDWGWCWGSLWPAHRWEVSRMGMGMGAVSVAARTGHPPSPAPVSPSPGGTVSWPWGSSLFFFSDSLLGCSSLQEPFGADFGARLLWRDSVGMQRTSGNCPLPSPESSCFKSFFSSSQTGYCLLWPRLELWAPPVPLP